MKELELLNTVYVHYIRKNYLFLCKLFFLPLRKFLMYDLTLCIFFFLVGVRYVNYHLKLKFKGKGEKGKIFFMCFLSILLLMMNVDR